MKCALCRHERELVESHIFPKFTYKRMREGDGRLRQFSTAHPDPEGSVVQDGIKEYLLCLECEGRFQKWEEYFARILYQKQLFDLKRPTDGKEWVRLEGLNYEKTKLFLLSILWRTDVTKHARFKVGLGEKHEARLRFMLLNANPGLPYEYGCVVAVPLVTPNDDPTREVRAAVTVSPENVRWKHGIRLVRMQVDGLLLQFVVGSDEVVRRHRVTDLFLQQDGKMVVGIEDLNNIGFLRNSWGRALGFI